ncbi:unnamed protein product [Rhizophagus irregularis]|nr:unnamed protein product [Rhizophagus irregularis]
MDNFREVLNFEEKCVVLDNQIESQKWISEDFLEDMSNNINDQQIMSDNITNTYEMVEEQTLTKETVSHINNDQQINEFVSNVGKMRVSITKTYEMLEEQTKLTKKIISFVNKVIDQNTRLNKLEEDIFQIYQTNPHPLADYMGWVRIFINLLSTRFGKKQWVDAEHAIDFLVSGISLTDYERNSIEKLGAFLHDHIEMSTDDFILLHKLKYHNYDLFHKSYQTLEQTKAQLNGPLSEDMKIYKVPLLKALKVVFGSEASIQS